MVGLLLYGESSHFSRKPDSRTEIMFISPNRFAVKNISFEDYLRGGDRDISKEESEIVCRGN